MLTRRRDGDKSASSSQVWRREIVSEETPRYHLCSHANESHRRPQRGRVDCIGVREWRAYGSEPVLARDGARVDL